MDDESDDPRVRRRKPVAEEETTPEDVIAAIEGQLGSMVEVRAPGEADEPILGAPVRRAVFEWMTEARAVEELKAVGLKTRSTCLLYGPPGTGKTTLAHHFAARLGLPLVIIRGEIMHSKYVGETGNNIGRFFDVMRKFEGKAVTFFDEMDALASTRIAGETSAGREQNAAVTALLTNIEAFRGLFFAATNRADSLDPAIWRRFGMQIKVALPEFDERFAILKSYARPFEFDEDLLDNLALLTAGAAPSLLRQLMEGVKRSLVLGPKLKRNTSDPVAVFKDIIAQVAPHPDYMQPPFKAPVLWAHPERVQELKSAKWPPVRGVA